MPEHSLIWVYIVAAGLICWERLFPSHTMKLSRHWISAALLINCMNMLVFILVAYGLDHIQSHSLFNLDESLPPLVGACIGYFIFTFVVYWWHRLRHSSKTLWLLFHQLHHSPTRIHTFTAYYIHPLDMIANLIISNTIVFLLLGLSIEGAAWYTLITGIAGFVIHANIKLPRQVGYFFQTPEMHRLHHKAGHHSHNFSDIVWWDMLFGTYCNPKKPIQHCGFCEKTEREVIPMLLGKNMNKAT